ncbi:MAG: recombinase family protein [bacterium]|nr:recombinase family protein [bacterium]
MEKVTLMCRVSSDEQALGYSLDDQFERLTQHCHRMGYEVVHVIKEDHSAKTFNRPEWKKWRELVTKGKLETDKLLVLTWDRFSRNLSEGLSMVDQLYYDEGITPEAVDQPIDLDIPEQRIILAVYLATPDVENRKRSNSVRRGIRQGLSQGRWPRKPLFGYKSATDELGKHIIVPDPETAPVVQEIFQEVARGVSQKEIRESLQERGIKVSRNNMSKILKRLLYMGKIIVPAREKEPMKIVQGIHEPLVSESLFYEVQQKLNLNLKARGKNQPKYKKLRNDLHLRGVLNCSNCGDTLTASFSRGKLGKRYGYYHCNGCKGERISATKVHEAFNELLESVTIDPAMRELYDAILEEMLNASKGDDKRQRTALNKQLDAINERLERSQDLMLDGKLDPDEYVSIKTRYKTQEDELKSQLRALTTNSKQIAVYLQSGLNLLSNIAETYENAAIQIKHKIVGSIFPEKFYFDGNKCRTPKLNSIVGLLISDSGDFADIKKGLSSLFTTQSPSAEREGFEPSVPG